MVNNLPHDHLAGERAVPSDFRAMARRVASARRSCIFGHKDALAVVQTSHTEGYLGNDREGWDGVRGRLNREEMHGCTQLIHAAGQQKRTQHPIVITLQLKKKKMAACKKGGPRSRKEKANPAVNLAHGKDFHGLLTACLRSHSFPKTVMFLNM